MIEPTEEDIGKQIIHGIDNEEIVKDYGVIIRIDDEHVHCLMNRNKKVIECKREDLDWGGIPWDDDGHVSKDAVWDNEKDSFVEPVSE